MTLTKQKADVCALCKQPIDWSWKNGEPDISIQMSKGHIGKFAHSSCVRAVGGLVHADCLREVDDDASVTGDA